jgi:hypothetical protein
VVTLELKSRTQAVFRRLLIASPLIFFRLGYQGNIHQCYDVLHSDAASAAILMEIRLVCLYVAKTT